MHILITIHCDQDLCMLGWLYVQFLLLGND